MWMNVTMKRKTAARNLNYIKKLYQNDSYMFENGLTLSTEKTNMVLFNSAYDPAKLPSFTINDVVIEYKRTVTVLGVFRTSKLSRNYQLEYVLTKARKILNVLNIVFVNSHGGRILQI